MIDGEQADDSQPSVAEPEPAPPAEEVEVARLKGSGIKTSKPFTVSDGWEVRWNYVGDDSGFGFFSISIEDESGFPVDVAANITDPGQGNSYQAAGGTRMLDVNAIGAWEVVVVDLP